MKVRRRKALATTATTVVAPPAKSRLQSSKRSSTHLTKFKQQKTTTVQHTIRKPRNGPLNDHFLKSLKRMPVDDLKPNTLSQFDDILTESLIDRVSTHFSLYIHFSSLFLSNQKTLL